MAVTAKFFADSGLAVELTTKNLLHAVDGSTDPNDQVLYLGSVTLGRLFRASSNPGTDQIQVMIENVTPVWTAATAKAVDDRVRTTAKNGYKYKCTVAGTTGGSEPTWPTTIGNTVVDGTVTWQCEGKIHESTEVKLAATSGGLAGATAGAPLSIGTSFDSGPVNAVPIHVRVTDATDVVGTQTELRLVTNDLVES